LCKINSLSASRSFVDFVAFHLASCHQLCIFPQSSKTIGGGVIAEAHEESYLKKKNAEKKGGVTSVGTKKKKERKEWGKPHEQSTL